MDRLKRYVQSFLPGATQSPAQTSQQGWHLTSAEIDAVQNMHSTLASFESAWQERATLPNSDPNTLIITKYADIELFYKQLYSIFCRDKNNAQNENDRQLLTTHHNDFLEVETLFNELKTEHNAIILAQQKAKFEKK